MTASDTLHNIVVIGAGFGGLETVCNLIRKNVRITLIDRRNHHLFQPLLYQVATSSLSPSEIAWPTRHHFRKRPEVTTLMATVTGIDKQIRTVQLDTGATIPYDTLVLATGARHAYFGHDDWETWAPGLKTLEDATTIRRRILMAFEKAERDDDPARRAARQTFVIIGGGPTGVEMAGAIAELAHSIARDFRAIDTRKTRVVLIEAGQRILPAFEEGLAAYARRGLEKLGIEVRTGAPVTECTQDGVTFGGEKLAARTIIWAAGVQASPAAEWIGAAADRAGRIQTNTDLTVPGHPEIFVIGDTAAVSDANGKPVPGVAPAAKQMGVYVARIINARLSGSTTPYAPFHYRHLGNLATIGKRLAVIDFGWIRLRGALAWWMWGLAHIYFLIGVRNRLAVALSWLWIHYRDHRSARLITEGSARLKS